VTALHVHYEFIGCPICGTWIDVRVSGITSGLGRSQRVCHGCGRVFSTNRVEWEDMSGIAKAWFWITTMLFAAFFGLLGGATFSSVVSFYEHGPWLRYVPFFRTSFEIGFACYAGLIAVLQLCRVMASIGRTENRDQWVQSGQGEPIPAYKPWWPLRLGLQGFLLFTVFVPLAVSWLAFVFLDLTGIVER
jgi:hypothetical protein